jgi:sucrose-6-phosphate hydrolase SacC (GH32 family)
VALMMPLLALVMGSSAVLAFKSAAPAVVGWDGPWLHTLRQEVASSAGIRTTLRPALAELRRTAESLLALEAPSVVAAGSVPLPGTGATSHDLWYLATYAWPCGSPCNASHFTDCSHWWQPPHYQSHGRCDNATGLPWEQHDGYVQPEGIADMAASDTMSDAVTTLALAGYLLGNQSFGTKAAALLRVWFVDPATSMTPSLEHAAVIPGVTNGSSTGIIVTSHRWNSRLTDALALLQRTGSLPRSVAAGVGHWNAKYLDWLVTSRHGKLEADMPQNHATWHTVEAAALALSSGHASTAAARLARLTADSTPAALGHQIKASGLMPLEAARTNGAGYSLMNVAGLFQAATIGKSAGSGVDLFTWTNTSDGSGSIRAALDYLIPFATNRSHPWPWPGVQSAPWTELAPQLLQAAVAYDEPAYEKMIPLLPWPGGKHWPQTKDWETNVARLLHPSTLEPVVSPVSKTDDEAGAQTNWDCHELLPPDTGVSSGSSWGCCSARNGTVAGSPALCSPKATPYGDCSRQQLWPKPTPPHFHVMDHTCDENDPNAPFYDAKHGVYHLFYQKHCATPVSGESIKGIVYGHVVSKDLLRWAHMPVAIWNDMPYDRYAIYSGSATIVDGVPHIIYPGLCLRSEWPADRRAHYCTNFVAAVPSDHPTDILLENWSKPEYNPIVNGSSKDPSAAWQITSATTGSPVEWRFSDNTGQIFSSVDGFQHWRSVGVLRGIPEGDCPSLFGLPAPTPGTLPAPAGADQPTHVHVTSGNPFGTWMQVGNYSHGAPHTPGEWAPLRPCLTNKPRLGGCGRSIDRGQTYAAKQFADPVNNRTLLWTWAYVRPNSTMALLRVITWNRELSQLEFAPLEEQAQLRESVLAKAANATVVAGQEFPLGTWTGGQGNTSETEVIFRLPSHAARFGIVVMANGKGSSSKTGTYFWVDYAGPQTNTAVVGAHSGGSAAASASRNLQYAKVMPGVNLRGMDLKVISGYKGNWSTCQALCAATAACQAWTWCEDCPAPASKCCLKSGLPVPSRSNLSSIPEIVSGIMHPELINSCPMGSNVSACRPTDELELSPTETTIALRVFVDQTFAEAYFQNGRSVLTVSVEPSAVASIALAVIEEEGSTGGGVVAESARVWSVKGIWTSAEQVKAMARLDSALKTDDSLAHQQLRRDEPDPDTRRYLPLLFIDDTLFERTHGGMSLRVQSPTVGPVVIAADKGWESLGISGYNHAMKFGSADYRIYYDCMEYDNRSIPGKAIRQERLCLARSDDGVNWTKPPCDGPLAGCGVVGGAHMTGSNVMAWCSMVSVFEDLNPTTQPMGRYKMLCSKRAYASPDGLLWTRISNDTMPTITHADDTQDSGWFDPAIGKYVIYVRRDLDIVGRNCSNKFMSGPNSCRLIGRCTTTDLNDWEQGNPAGCPPVFGPDAQDPQGIDLYTSGFAPYEGVQLFFPATMYTFGASFPWGYGNDGILDIRFAASRDGKTIRYVPGAANAREPWFELGLNRCGAHASAPDSYRGGWCDPGDQGQMRRTDPHTTTNYMTGGLMESPTGEELYMYVGSPNTMGHGEVFTTPPVYPGSPKDLPPWRPPLSPPTGGISLLRVRKHGFVAVEGPTSSLLPLANSTDCRPVDYPSAAGPSEKYPGFTTVAMDMPVDCNGSLVLVVNAKTSVAGFVQIGFVQPANTTDYSHYMYRLCNSDPLRGNFLAATASWGGGSARTMPTRGDHSVQLEVILVAANLFSLQFKCI